MSTASNSRWLSLVATLSIACGSAAPLYRLSTVPAPPPLPLTESFISISDTQYAVPFTDYDVNYWLGDQLVDLPPFETTSWSRSFYRHAGAHLAVKDATDAILAQETNRREFGLFGGDMAEFSCAAETDTMFKVFAAHPKLPFIVAIGNHDSTFHGSYDTDAIGANGQGPWDKYSFDLWDFVCRQHGGRLTKTGFIKQLLTYYESTWGFDFHDALARAYPHDSIGKQGDDYPLWKPLDATVTSGEWSLSFSLQLGPDNDPGAHRHSYFYQRWTKRKRGEADPTLTITVLDTMDVGSRKILCDKWYAQALQIGLAGGISQQQLSWIHRLPKVSGQHFVLSHHFPFQDVIDEQGTAMGACETTFGTRCLGNSLQHELGPATYLYAHVHKDFERESVIGIDTLKQCKVEQASDEATYRRSAFNCSSDDPRCQGLPLVRLPSLIDNKSYVVFEQGAFRAQPLPRNPALQSMPPYHPLAGEAGDKVNRSTCEQRYLEYLELDRNLKCFQSQQSGAGASACPLLAEVLDGATAQAVKLCRDSASAWKAENPTPWSNVKGECDVPQWPAAETWRCILSSLTRQSFAAAPLTPEQRATFSLQLLSAVCPLTATSDDCQPGPDAKSASAPTVGKP